MMTEKEKRVLIERSWDSFKRVRDTCGQAVHASQKAATATQRSIDLMSKFGVEMGRRAPSVREITEYLTSKGRIPELDEFLRVVRSDEEAGRKAEEVSTEAELAYARAQTFLAD